MLASSAGGRELFGFSLVVELKVPTSSSRNLVLIIGQQLDKEKGQDQVLD